MMFSSCVYKNVLTLYAKKVIKGDRDDIEVYEVNPVLPPEALAPRLGNPDQMVLTPEVR